MYQTKILGDRLYHAKSKGHSQPVETFGTTDEGETPMSLLNISLASCVTMCIQGYYKRQEGIEEMAVSVDATYEDEIFNLLIEIDLKLTESDKENLIDYINRFCRVKKLLRSDIEINYSFKNA